MGFKLMGLKINLRFEDCKLLIQAFLIHAQKMIFPEVYLKGIIIHVILLRSTLIPSIADMAFFMLVSAVGEQLVVAVESLPAKATFRMSLESALVNSAGVVVAKLFVPAQILRSIKIMFMRKNFLVSGT